MLKQHFVDVYDGERYVFVRVQTPLLGIGSTLYVFRDRRGKDCYFYEERLNNLGLALKIEHDDKCEELRALQIEHGDNCKELRAARTELQHAKEELGSAKLENDKTKASYESRLAETHAINTSLMNQNRKVTGEVLVGTIAFPTASKICEEYDSLQTQLQDILEELLEPVAHDYSLLGAGIVDPMFKVLLEFYDKEFALKKNKILEEFRLPIEEPVPSIFSHFLKAAWQTTYESVLDHSQDGAERLFAAFLEEVKAQNRHKAPLLYDFLRSDDASEVMDDFKKLFGVFLMFTFRYKLSDANFVLYPSPISTGGRVIYSEGEHKEISDRGARRKCNMARDLSAGKECKVVIPALMHLGEDGQRIFDIPMRVW